MTLTASLEVDTLDGLQYFALLSVKFQFVSSHVKISQQR